jgi:hypothetical protein
MITLAVVPFPVVTVTVWEGLTPPLGILLKTSGLVGLVPALTVRAGCADAVSEQPTTANAASAANIKDLRWFMAYLISLGVPGSAIMLPFDYKTN